jgi:carboxyl-terminal processing protease
VVIGERTWGKGSVQNLIDLQDGKSALKLTTAAYRRPSGKNIHRFPESKESDEWGVRPDPNFEVAIDDRQTLELFRVRRDRDIVAARAFKTPEAEGVAPTPDSQPNGEAKPAAEATQGPSTGDTVAPKSEPAPAEAQVKIARPTADAPFVDPQLNKAVEYLTQELSRPLASNTAPEPEPKR